MPTTVAMSVTGHRTASIFARYNITSEADQREAMAKVSAHRAAVAAE